MGYNKPPEQSAFDCSHQFIGIPVAIGKPNILNQNVTPDKVFTPMRTIYGVAAVCAVCGEVRNCYEDGTIEIMNKNND